MLNIPSFISDSCKEHRDTYLCQVTALNRGN